MVNPIKSICCNNKCLNYKSLVGKKGGAKDWLEKKVGLKIGLVGKKRWG
jgi:hypothetical protein